MTAEQLGQRYAGDCAYQSVGNSVVIHADCLEWMRRVPGECFHAIVTDLHLWTEIAYDPEPLAKCSNSHSGIWRIPP